MNFSKEQKDYIIQALEHCEVLTGGRSSGKTLELIKQQDKEIERLNKQLEEKTYLYNKLSTESEYAIKQLHSIIKEVRELVVKLKEDNTSYYDECLVDNFIRDSLEILDKGE